MSLLDRLLLRRTCINLLLLMLVVVGLFVAFDLLLNLHKYLKYTASLDQHPAWLIAQFYAYRLPTIVHNLLAPLFVAACLVTTTPALRKREFVALASTGVGPRAMCRSLLVLALAVGLLDVVLGDQVVPRLEARGEDISGFLARKWYMGRIWTDPQTDAVWYAHTTRLPNNAAPIFEVVAVVPPAGGMAIARHLDWTGDHWQLRPPIHLWNGGSPEKDHYRLSDRVVDQPELQCWLSPTRLRDELISRHALTSQRLWHRPGQLFQAVIISRGLRFFLPALMVMLALPLFVRFATLGHLIGTGVRAFLLALVVPLITSIAARSGEISSLGAWLPQLIGSGLCGCAALLSWSRWRL